MRSTYTRLIPNLADISKTRKTAQICPSNNNISLISIGKLCDDGYEVKINKKVCKVCKENKTILIALGYSNTGMHIMDINHLNPLYLINALLANKQQKLVNIQDFVDIDRTKFLYASISGLLLSMVKQAIKAGYLQSRPSLTEKSINKLQESNYTILGHMDHV